MSTVKKPILGITMGDPAGNGPELCVQALLHKAIYEEWLSNPYFDQETKRSMTAAAPSSSATPPRWSTPRQCTIN